MTSPDPRQVQELTRKHVLKADAKDTLHTLTPKVLRREIEKELNLEEGDLDAPELRNAVKTAIESTMAELGSGRADEVDDTATKPESSANTSAKGKKRTSDVGANKVPKEPRATKKQTKEEKKPRKRKSKTADTEASPSLHEQSAAAPADSDGEDKPTSTKPPAKRRKTTAVRIEDSENEPSEEIKSETQEANAELKDVDIPMSEPHEDLLAATKEDTSGKADYKSESELSVLIDESPKPKRKTKAAKDQGNNKKSNAKVGPKSKKAKPENLSKDEETIKRLKSFVVACGVRKVWSKVFQGLDTPGQQIKKLKETLHELGMTGRMSLEQAKAIREKREFEQELQDVQEFQQAIMKSGRRRSTAEENDDENASDSEGEEEDLQPRRRKMNAAQSITAFLGDQSSDDN